MTSTIKEDKYGNIIYKRKNEDEQFFQGGLPENQEEFFERNPEATNDDFLESVRVMLDGAY